MVTVVWDVRRQDKLTPLATPGNDPQMRRDIFHTVGVVQALPVIDTTGRQEMQTPEDVAQMLRLKAAGLGIKHIARKMGCSKNTGAPLPAWWRLGGVQAT